MKKSVALAIAAAMSLSVAGTALAANPFSDVPQGHWAYDAIAQLEKDGLVTGYGDGTYRGDRAMSRYEMATVVAQLDDANGENAEMINRLRSEFATELYNLGVRVDRLEKNASTIKFTGDARIRYQKNTGNALSVSPDISGLPLGSTHRFEQRVRINMDAAINEKVQFKGRINYTNVSNNKDHLGLISGSDAATSLSRDVWLDRAEIVWTSGTLQGRFGRITPTLGQGLIWYDNPADGALIGYKSGKWDIFGGVLDYSPMRSYQLYNNGDGNGTIKNLLNSVLPGAGILVDKSLNATVAQIGYHFNDKVAVTAAYSNGHGGISDNDSALKLDGYNYELIAFGATADFGRKWNLTAEYIKNNSDVADMLKDYLNVDDDGYWVRATYGKADMNKKGSFSVYAEYLNIGGGAMDGLTYGHRLDIPTTPGVGTKGYGIGIAFVPAKNINMQFIYHDLKSSDLIDFDYRNSYQFVTNFRF